MLALAFRPCMVFLFISSPEALVLDSLTVFQPHQSTFCSHMLQSHAHLRALGGVTSRPALADSHDHFWSQLEDLPFHEFFPTSQSKEAVCQTPSHLYFLLSTSHYKIIVPFFTLTFYY
jgi:hypothetical protein